MPAPSSPCASSSARRTSITPSAGSANAVKVTVRTSVPLFFGGLVGRPETEMVASAVALGGEEEGYAVVGIDWVRLNSFGIVDAYDSSAGSYGATRGHGGSIASNGFIDLNSNSILYGDAWHLPGESVRVSGSSIVAPGSIRLLQNRLYYPPQSLPSNYVNLGSHTQNGGALTLSSGNYLYKDLVINAGAELVVNGDVTIYVTSKFEIHSHSSGIGHAPSRLKIVGLGKADLIVNSHTGLSADIYAPESKVTVNSHSTLYGRVVGGEVLINSFGSVHHDKSMSKRANNTSRLVQ